MNNFHKAFAMRRMIDVFYLFGKNVFSVIKEISLDIVTEAISQTELTRFLSQRRRLLA